jgi:hypothetical protein
MGWRAERYLAGPDFFNILADRAIGCLVERTKGSGAPPRGWNKLLYGKRLLPPFTIACRCDGLIVTDLVLSRGAAPLCEKRFGSNVEPSLLGCFSFMALNNRQALECPPDLWSDYFTGPPIDQIWPNGSLIWP